ncbi:MAG: saccharopine dehydrogenase NADP-binding domain-containing protein [Acidimicrobiia bacterium]|nr:saccharopine dehydrogenase NADP-binding domain-containing protein [Acidimicrobiia bacterium]
MIVLYGATGFTGRLVAAELARIGEPFVIAGRSEAKLDGLARELAAASPAVKTEVRVASLHDPGALESLVGDATAVTSAAGPFARIGMPLVEACHALGVPYCDTTGEPEFMHEVRTRFPEGAAPIVPAAGFDYVPHDLGAALAARSLGAVERIDTVLLVRHMAPTRGTMRSALEAAARPLPVFEGGVWTDEAVAVHTRTFSFPPPMGVVRAVSYGGGDAVQIANHVPASAIRTWAVLPGPLTRLAGPASRIGGPVLGTGAVQRALGGLLERVPEGPRADARARTSFGVLVEATSPTGKTARTLVAGTDIYATTAILNTRIVTRLARDGASLAGGFRAPSEVVGDPVVFAAECGLELERVP